MREHPKAKMTSKEYMLKYSSWENGSFWRKEVF
jgi:hypothetical protein